MNKIKIAENISIVTCIAASITVSFYASEANFKIVFALFLISAAILAVTMYIKKQTEVFRLQVFFVIMNSFALAKEFVSV